VYFVQKVVGVFVRFSLAPLHLTTVCYLQVVVLLQHAQGFVQHVNTGGYRPFCLPINIKTIVLGNSSVLLSYNADAAVYGLFCSEYCCMHRVLCLT
jgi:hypothetical protein